MRTRIRIDFVVEHVGDSMPAIDVLDFAEAGLAKTLPSALAIEPGAKIRVSALDHAAWPRISTITLARRPRRVDEGSGTTALERFREAGWMVAVHNDYRSDGRRMTFWLFTHPSGVWAKGEGESDAVALGRAEEQASKLELRPHGQA